jgi:hypothetical protein
MNRRRVPTGPDNDDGYALEEPTFTGHRDFNARFHGSIVQRFPLS